MHDGKSLHDLLAEAASGREPEIRRFYEALFESSVLVPINIFPKGEHRWGERVADAAKEEPLVVNHGGRDTIPLFTDRAAVELWTDMEVLLREKQFSKLLWLVPAERWLHLNPGSEVGKEFSPWEIDCLRRGSEAIDEVLAELERDEGPLEVSSATGAEYEALKAKLRILLESFPQVSEAFLVSIAEDAETENAPLVVLRSEGLREEKRRQLIAELEELSRAMLGPSRIASVIDDLGAPQSQGEALVRHLTPFYFAQRSVVSERRSVLALVKERFSRKK